MSWFPIIVLTILGVVYTSSPEVFLKRKYRSSAIPEKALRTVRTLGLLMLLAAFLFLMLILVSSRG